MSAYERMERLCRGYADARGALEEVAEEIDRARRHAVRRRVRRLRNRAAEASAARDALEREIEASPQLFDRPRTRSFEGVKVGFQKQKGSCVVADAARTMQLVRKHLPDREEDLVNVKETLAKAGLTKLTGGELKKIGVHVTDAVDKIVIATAASEVEKLVDALLESVEDDEGVVPADGLEDAA